MIDREDDDGPTVDLSPLDSRRDGLLADRVIGGAMARIGAARLRRTRTDTPTAMLTEVASWWRPGLAAAVLVAVASGTAVVVLPVVRSEVSVGDAVETQLLDWARSGHIPTNGDLLSTFSGMAR